MESQTGTTSPISTDSRTGTTVRAEMKRFWSSYSQEPNVTKMLLDSNAEKIGKEELPEVLSLLPDMRGKKILELAGGIGRFTGIIAQHASHVTTVDFIEQFIDESKRNNSTFTNIDYVIDDVMNVEFENESFDLIFSNWLLIYFSDDDLSKLLRKLLMWLKDGGFLFCRESCGEASGNIRDRYNPALYRLPQCYSKYFESASVKSDEHTRWGFSLRFTRNLQSYIKLKGNRDSICWLLQKKRLSEDIENCDFNQFLRNKESSVKTILRYEKIFGDGFIRVEGLQMLQEFTNNLQHHQGQKVLDVGCGIGGTAFYMAKEHGADVLGVDASSLLIDIAWERKYNNHKNAHVCFEVGDISQREYPANFFDVIISRDTMRCNRDKKKQLKLFLDWLKEGGRIIIADLCCGKREDKQRSEDNFKGDRCELYTVKEYTEMIEETGFLEVKSEDRSKEMVAFINNARTKVTENMQDLLMDFSKDELANHATTWGSELKRYEAKECTWCLFCARKPTLDQR